MEQFRSKIETFGNYYEQKGFPPVASRIMIYLLLSPETETTFDELLDYFKVSKSAVSNALKLLSMMEIVTEKTKSGARKRYFSINLHHIFSVETALKSYRETRQILEEISDLRSKKQNEVTAELNDTIAFLKKIESIYPELYKEVREKNHRK